MWGCLSQGMFSLLDSGSHWALFILMKSTGRKGFLRGLSQKWKSSENSHWFNMIFVYSQRRSDFWKDSCTDKLYYVSFCDFFFLILIFIFFTLQQQLRLQQPVYFVGIVKYNITKPTAPWKIPCNTSHFLPIAVSSEPSLVHLLIDVIFLSACETRNGMQYAWNLSRFLLR